MVVQLWMHSAQSRSGHVQLSFQGVSQEKLSTIFVHCNFTHLYSGVKSIMDSCCKCWRSKEAASILRVL